MNYYNTILLGLLLSFSGIANDKVIYSEDDRFETSSIQAYYFAEQASSVAGMISKKRLWTRDNNSYFYEHLSLQSAGFPMMPFYHQQLLTECSGFLIDDKTIATASHCIADQSDCDNNYWVFNFTKETANQGVFYKNELFECQEIIVSKKDTDKAQDFALIKLKDAPKGISPLKYNSSKVEDKSELVMIGHPLGLPKKFIKNAFVLSNDNPTYFSAYIDAFSGNSGSPVFNAKTGLVEGLLFRGAADFIEEPDGSEVLNICFESYEDCGQGEDIQRISEVVKYLN